MLCFSCALDGFSHLGLETRSGIGDAVCRLVLGSRANRVGVPLGVLEEALAFSGDLGVEALCELLEVRGLGSGTFGQLGRLDPRDVDDLLGLAARSLAQGVGLAASGVEDLVARLLGGDEGATDRISRGIGFLESGLEGLHATLIGGEGVDQPSHDGVDLGRVVSVAFDAAEPVCLGGRCADHVVNLPDHRPRWPLQPKQSTSRSFRPAI